MMLVTLISTSGEEDGDSKPAGGTNTEDYTPSDINRLDFNHLRLPSLQN